MKRKKEKRVKEVFNWYNVIIILLLIMIAVSLIIIIKPEVKNIDFEEIMSSINIKENMKNNEEISEEKAKKIAIGQFNKLGEEDIKEEDIKLAEIERNGEYYYYIRSQKNTLEIKKIGGKLARINGVVVE